MKTNKKYPNPSRIASVKKLQYVWQKCREAHGKGGAAGVDRKSPAIFRENLETNIWAIHRELVTGKYKFSDLQPHLILKDNGKHRVICVPTVRDRLAQRMMLQHLASSKEKDMLRVINGVSYGVAKGKEQGVHAT